ncbi:hypothetical protein AKJ52_02880 [candidate division MSBL1 archaeon SCGC-AAA382C18]|uniref:EamA domain-containing protein n=1 Tax=candidate division MSBL1 archaeon SCGC-AAA382C18 TaxID=1698281 RepID=A0A133VHG8_9EURY|nr:hypothetical protein AKJ52_02880 [candidate division MSBL1 archaeon SCGC-AAA382C18]
MLINPDILGALLGLATAIFMGMRIIFVRKATITGKSLDALYISVFVCFATFLPLSFIYLPHLVLNLKSFMAFLSAGLIAMVMATSFYYIGTKRLGASITAPIRNASLLVTVVIALIILDESATFIHIVGIFLILTGVVIVARKISTDNSNSELEDYYLNLLFPIGAMIGFGLANSLIKFGLSQGTPMWVGLAIMNSFAILTIIGYYLWKGKSLLDPFLTDEKYLYLGAGISLAAGLITLFLGLNKSDLVIVTPFKTLAPLFTLILSYLFLRRHEIIDKKIIIGTATIVSGTVLVGAFM